MNTKIIFLKTSLIALLLFPLSVWAQESDSGNFLGEMYQIQDYYESLEDDYKEDSQKTAEAAGEDAMEALDGQVATEEEEGYDYFAVSTGRYDMENDEANWVTDDFTQNTRSYSSRKLNVRRHEAADLTSAAEAMAATDDEEIYEIADMANVPSIKIDEALDDSLYYQIDEIERMLDRKLDLQSGYFAADLAPTGIPEDYGFSAADADAKIAEAQHELDIPLQEKGVDYWTYNSDDDRIPMAEQRKENMELIRDDLVERENMVLDLNNSLAEIQQNGGVALTIDHLDEEVKFMLLELDRDIIKILKVDAYDQDDEMYDAILVHPITGAVLKGYARRKALAEIAGGKYAHVEDMKSRNLAGVVLEEDEIIGLMQRLYPGYNPYVE